MLKANGKPAIAVEAKKLSAALGGKEAAQLVKYCSVIGVRWGLLTDGQTIRVYDAPVTGVTPEDRLVLHVDLNDWADREDFDLRIWPMLSMLSREAMTTGEALERYAAREVIRTLVTDPESATVRALRKELQEKKIVLNEKAIGELVSELIQ